ncbi:11497_t:CDS:2 [Diversispora eburnea]|uniref:11497_t:CDS:1 n=1 Tax=Diversispora eburnea TaxID=1213867 RepID=A0A9N8UUZ1_9GLOM|nr:11497_t:CDS:2 [Diversispora eburnea]
MGCVEEFKSLNFAIYAQCDQFVKQFKNNWVRTVGYLAFASIMFVSVVINTTSLIAPGITLFFSGACYGIAALKHQPPAASTITGGNGISISSVSAIGRTLV